MIYALRGNADLHTKYSYRKDFKLLTPTTTHSVRVSSRRFLPCYDLRGSLPVTQKSGTTTAGLTKANERKWPGLRLHLT